jgi:hypothetical protein
MWATQRLTMANGVPSQFPFSTYYLDIAGSEREPSIESEPVPRSYLAYARALLYHKPLVLLYKPRLEERFDRDLSPYLVDYMHACLPYAAEPSLFMLFSDTDPSFYYNFWERPDWYNRYRSIFIDFLPLVKRLALAGWEPVTQARASDPSIVVERFGSQDLHLVAHNPARQGAPVTFTLEVDAGLPVGSLACAVNLVDGAAVPVLPRPEGGVRLQLTLAPRRSAVLAFAAQRQHLVSFDLGEAARYGEIAVSRLQDKLNPTSDLDFKSDPGDTGTPAGFAPYREGEVTFSSERQACHSAPRCTKVVLSGKARAVQTAQLRVQPGITYRFSMWGKADLPTPGTVSFYVRWKDELGKDGKTLDRAPLTATSDWKQLELTATAPATATAVMLALVGTHQGEGTGTVWFDDPSVVALGENGQQTALLPALPVTPSATATRLAAELQQRREQLQKLLVSAPDATDASAACARILALATELDQQAAGVRRETPEYANVAAALDVSAGRLRRAGGVLAAWQLTLTGGGQVALGETPQFVVQVQAGALPLEQVSVALQGEAGPVGGPAPAPFALKVGESKTFSFSSPAPGSVGTSQRLKARARASVAGGHVLTLEREASYSLVSPCESTLQDLGQDEDGRVRRLLLNACNRRREKTLPVHVTVSPPQGFTASVTDQTIDIAPGAELKLPISLTVGGSEPSGWLEATIKATWEGGEQSHPYAQLYCPASANRLTNPGFEGSQDTTATGWAPAGKSGYTLDAKIAHAGKQSVRVSGPAAGARQRLELNQSVARPLILRGWSRCEQPGEPPAAVMTIGQTEQAPSAAARRSADYALYVDLHYMAGGALYGQVATFDPTAAGWQFSEKIISVNQPVKDATVYLLYRHPSGSAWFDDVLLAEAEPNLALLPGVMAKTDSSYQGYTPAALTDGVTDTAGLPWDKAAWASDDAAREHWVELTFPREVTLQTVLLYWAVDVGNTWTSCRYAIQVLADGAWRDVATVAGQSQRDLSVHRFAPVATTRLRLLQPAGGGPVTRPNLLWLREIAVLPVPTIPE